MHTAGRPASPSLHPRTRPEGNQFAMKNKATGDWFRHDGKNVEVEPPPPQRLQGYVAPEVAEKAKGEPEQWYQHNANNPTDPPPKTRIHSQEAQQVQKKVKGTEEQWYKTEENQDYYSARPKSRVTTVQGQECLEKMTRGDTNDWYRHEHKGEEYQPEPHKSRTGPLPHVGGNKAKLQGVGEPNWYQHDGKTEAGVNGDDRPHSRVQTADAQEYLERNRGSAGDWYQHGQKAPASYAPSPRAHGTTSDSENWFSHDANKSYNAPIPVTKAASPAAKEMIEKSRGQGMGKALAGEGMKDEVKPARVKPEANNIAQKNVQGMMSKYLSQDANRGYQSNRAGGRVVKTEASANADRNRGVLSDQLTGGYAQAAPAKRDGPRVKAEAAQNAARNQGTMGAVMFGGSNNEPRAVSRTKPEAEANKNRNQGQGFSQLMGNYGNMRLDDKPTGRAGSASARAAADRNKGSIGSLLGMG